MIKRKRSLNVDRYNLVWYACSYTFVFAQQLYCYSSFTLESFPRTNTFLQLNFEFNTLSFINSWLLFCISSIFSIIFFSPHLGSLVRFLGFWSFPDTVSVRLGCYGCRGCIFPFYFYIKHFYLSYIYGLNSRFSSSFGWYFSSVRFSTSLIRL